jgi:hypothetical protein
MTQRQYIINRKLNILELGRTLGNISEACRKLGISRQHYYDIKTAIDEEGLEGLLEKSRRSPRIGNRNIFRSEICSASSVFTLSSRSIAARVMAFEYGMPASLALL